MFVDEAEISHFQLYSENLVGNKCLRYTNEVPEVINLKKNIQEDYTWAVGEVLSIRTIHIHM